MKVEGFVYAVIVGVAAGIITQTLIWRVKPVRDVVYGV